VQLCDLSKELFALWSWSRRDQASTQVADLIGCQNAARRFVLDWILELKTHATGQMTVEVERTTDALAGRASEELAQTPARDLIEVIADDLHPIAGPDLETVLPGGELNG
jgi:hypothetical protein